MAMEDTSKMQDELDALNAQITKQGSADRQLKKDGAAADAEHDQNRCESG